MIDPLILAAFIPAALALNMTPGADMMFCVAQGLKSGARAASFASAGIALGALVHTFIAGAGLSALLMRWPVAFDVIRWLGVAYLLWLAYRALVQPASQTADAPTKSQSAFRSGLIVNLSNPKVILFVLAFIPQFVSPEAGPVLFQFVMFGCVMSMGGLLVNGLVGMWAGSFGQRLARGSKMLDRITAGIFSLLALRLAVLERT